MAPEETQPDEPLSDFGRYLQACRLASDQSLDDVAQLTKINRTCLRQIENESLADLPQDVFVKGFLRAYAEAVGADTGEALRRYQNRCGLERRSERAEVANSQRRRKRMHLLAVALLFAGVVSLTFYMVRMVRPAEDGHTEQRSGPDAVLPDDAASNVQAAPIQTDTEPEQERSPTLDLRVSAVAHTRLKIIADAGLPQEFNLQVGEQVAVAAEKHLNLLIGNAGGIRLTLNGNPVVIPGKKGQVVTLNLP